MRRVLFVCTGNLCRSPLACALFERLVAEAGLSVEARSAGLYASPGGRPPAEALAIAKEAGLDLSGHAASSVSREAFEAADLVLVAERVHASDLQDLYPRDAGKIRLLSEFADGAHRGREITDPFGRPLPYYRASLEEIRECVQGLVDRLVGDLQAPPLPQGPLFRRR